MLLDLLGPQVRELVAAVDEDSSGSLEFAEFKDVLSMQLMRRKASGWQAVAHAHAHSPPDKPAAHTAAGGGRLLDHAGEHGSGAAADALPRRDQQQPGAAAATTWLLELSAGDVAGESSVSVGPAMGLSGTLTAQEDCELLVLTRERYLEVLQSGFDAPLRARTALLQAAPALRDLLRHTPLRPLAGVARLARLARGEPVCEQGAAAAALVLILTGQCTVSGGARRLA